MKVAFVAFNKAPISVCLSLSIYLSVLGWASGRAGGWVGGGWMCCSVRACVCQISSEGGNLSWLPNERAALSWREGYLDVTWPALEWTSVYPPLGEPVSVPCIE